MKLSSEIDLDVLGSRVSCTFLNHYSYLTARKERQDWDAFDYIFCDGILLCWAFRLWGVKVLRRSFDTTSLAPLIFKYSEDRGLKVVFIGGEEGVASRAGAVIKKKYPNLDIVGCISGYFEDDLHRMNVIKSIIGLNPDIVICGMGVPLQEFFLRDLRRAGWLGTGFTCGGFFHQTAKAGLQYYPRWMDKANLRWLYRIYDEPKLIRRYTYDFFRFMFFFNLDNMRSKGLFK